MINDTLGQFYSDQKAKDTTNSFIKKVISEVKRCGYCYIPNNDTVINKIKELEPSFSIEGSGDNLIVYGEVPF